MNINLLPYAVFWGVLALVVLFLIVYRKSISSHEDDSIHLAGGMVAEQVTLGHRLSVIDRWGKTLRARRKITFTIENVWGERRVGGASNSILGSAGAV